MSACSIHNAPPARLSWAPATAAARVPNREARRKKGNGATQAPATCLLSQTGRRVAGVERARAPGLCSATTAVEGEQIFSGEKQSCVNDRRPRWASASRGRARRFCLSGLFALVVLWPSGVV